jgi:hypothetical protein
MLTGSFAFTESVRHMSLIGRQRQFAIQFQANVGIDPLPTVTNGCFGGT